MDLYGTRREHFAEIAIRFREHALRNSDAAMKTPLTREEYFASRLIVAPLGLFDCSLRSDGAGAVIVTTPQEVAVGDALRGAKMFERVGVPVIGVVENMSGYTDPETGRSFDFFSSGGGQRLADEIAAPLLGSVPLQPQLAALADNGQPVLVAQPQSPAARSLRDIAEVLQQKTVGRSMALPILRG